MSRDRLREALRARRNVTIREVMEGLGGALKDSRLHTVAVEVHFNLFVERGQPGAPAEIEEGLRSAGLSTRWTDASHIVGRRL